MLGHEPLVFAKRDGLAADGDVLGPLADQMHFHAARRRRPDCFVPKPGQVEIGAQFPVQTHQGIEIELGGHAGRVIVGALENPLILDEVIADHQRAVRPGNGAHRAQQLDGRGRIEVPDRRARKEYGHPRRGTLWSGHHEGLRKVRAHRQDFEFRIGLRNAAGCGKQMGPRNIHRHVGGQIRQLVQQQPCLGAGAAAELDQHGVRSDLRSDLRAVRRKDAGLGAGQIVLGQRADPVEQVRAVFVIKVGRREMLRVVPEAGENVGDQRLIRRTRLNAANIVMCSHCVIRRAPGAVPKIANAPTERRSFGRSRECASWASRTSHRATRVD